MTSGLEKSGCSNPTTTSSSSASSTSGGSSSSSSSASSSATAAAAASAKSSDSGAIAGGVVGGLAALGLAAAALWFMKKRKLNDDGTQAMKTLSAGGAGASPSFHHSTGTNFAAMGAGAGLGAAGGAAAYGQSYVPVPSPASTAALSGGYYQNSEPEQYYGRDGGQGQWVDNSIGGSGYGSGYAPSQGEMGYQDGTGYDPSLQAAGYPSGSPPLQDHVGIAPVGYNPSASLSPSPYSHSPEIQDIYAQQPQSFQAAHPGSLAPSGSPQSFQPAHAGSLLPSNSPPQWAGGTEGQAQGYGGQGGDYALAPPVMNDPVGRLPTPGYGLALPGAPPTPAPGGWNPSGYAAYNANDLVSPEAFSQRR